MYGSLFWIEWLERLDRVLTGIRMDLPRAASPRGLAAMERSTRQLSALTHDLQLLDRNVLRNGASSGDNAEELERALESTLAHLTTLAELQDSGDADANQRALAGLDASLRNSRHQAAMLVEPRRRRA
ncbi:MAG TPA: hypothetical protein VHV81_06905 [Steroidobacteraceae bacterium]|jgi:hypothetical protein|nr:hypothetical protein [Steroidobacteraceae bacterium]